MSTENINRGSTWASDEVSLLISIWADACVILLTQFRPRSALTLQSKLTRVKLTRVTLTRGEPGLVCVV